MMMHRVPRGIIVGTLFWLLAASQHAGASGCSVSAECLQRLGAGALALSGQCEQEFERYRACLVAKIDEAKRTVPSDICVPKEKTLDIGRSYLTADACDKLSDETLALYLMGVSAGLLSSPFLGAPSKCVEIQVACLQGRLTGKDLASIYRISRATRADTKHADCSVAFFFALRGICTRQ